MFRSILVPVDLDEPASWDKALEAGIALSRQFGASLALATVVPDLRLILEAQQAPITLEEMLETARARLDVLADTLEGSDGISRHVEAGGIYSTILAIADTVHADLIVMASHHPAMKDYLLGSNASRVVRHATCSVMVVRH
ncbi:MAG: universal stress protein [Sphingobium sp.]